MTHEVSLDNKNEAPHSDVDIFLEDAVLEIAITNYYSTIA